MLDKLNLVAKKSQQDKRMKFTSLFHHINEANLAACYQRLKRDKACGVDGETVASYGENLEANLSKLVERLQSKRYRPKPVRRAMIPKPGKVEKRKLGIPSVEDKLVQMGLKQILEAIYESDFQNFSYGFRPGRSCHHAVKALDMAVMTKPVNYVVEVDIRKFFDEVSHYWLQRCLEERIADRNILWLARRFLKTGVLADGELLSTTVGTPQGGDYILDLWFEKRFKPQSKGYIEIIRYCDDFVVCCESEHDAKNFLMELRKRFAKFGLRVAEDKTKVLKFGRKVWQLSQKRKEKVESFNFLGFTHYCTKSRRGKFIMGHKTSKENLSRKLKETKEWLKKVRNQFALKDWWPTLKAKLTGHYNYFGISGNYRCLMQFYKSIFWMTYKWINRRSQKKSMTYEQYVNYLQFNPLPTPRICYALYTL